MDAKVIIESGRNGDLEYYALSINGTIFRMSTADYQSFRDRCDGLTPEEFITDLAQEIYFSIDGRMF